jgi:hypothetical protein
VRGVSLAIARRRFAMIVGSPRSKQGSFPARGSAIAQLTYNLR